MRIQIFVVVALAYVLTHGTCLIVGFEFRLDPILEITLLAAAVVMQNKSVRARYHKLSRYFDFCGQVILLRFTLHLALRLAYAGQTFGMPLCDEQFLRFNEMLGFDYVAFMRWFATLGPLLGPVKAVYKMFIFIVFLLIIIGSIAKPRLRIGEQFICTLLASLMICAIVAGLFPALGAIIVLPPDLVDLAPGASPLDHLASLRAGTMTSLDGIEPGPILSFPSMHVVLGIIAPYAVRQVAWAFPGIAILGAGQIATAIPNGAHYLADVGAGLAVAIVAITLTNRLYRASNRSPAVEGWSGYR